MIDATCLDCRTIILRNTTIQHIRDFGVRIEKKAADGALVKFEGGLIQDVAKAGHNPILIQSGGVHFNGTVVKDTHMRDWLKAGWRTYSAVTNVEGTVSVFTPNGQCSDSFNETRGDEHSNLKVTCRKLS